MSKKLYFALKNYQEKIKYLEGMNKNKNLTEKLDKKLEIAVEALRLYASEYSETAADLEFLKLNCGDDWIENEEGEALWFGDTARKALKKIEGKK